MMSRQKCVGFNKPKNERCGNLAVKDSKYCRWHMQKWHEKIAEYVINHLNRVASTLLLIFLILFLVSLIDWFFAPAGDLEFKNYATDISIDVGNTSAWVGLAPSNFSWNFLEHRGNVFLKIEATDNITAIYFRPWDYTKVLSQTICINQICSACTKESCYIDDAEYSVFYEENRTMLNKSKAEYFFLFTKIGGYTPFEWDKTDKKQYNLDAKGNKNITVNLSLQGNISPNGGFTLKASVQGGSLTLTDDWKLRFEAPGYRCDQFPCAIRTSELGFDVKYFRDKDTVNFESVSNKNNRQKWNDFEVHTYDYSQRRNKELLQTIWMISLSLFLFFAGRASNKK